MAEFQKLECQIVVVACGIQKSGLKWMETTKLSFPLFLDIDLKLYRLLGLRRSVKRVWGVYSLLGYAEEKVAGKKSTPRYEGDDVHVMGGDFIVNSAGQLVYAYQSKTQRDRPAVGDLLQFLSEP